MAKKMTNLSTSGVAKISQLAAGGKVVWRQSPRNGRFFAIF